MIPQLNSCHDGRWVQKYKECWAQNWKPEGAATPKCQPYFTDMERKVLFSVIHTTFEVFEQSS